MKCKKCNTDLQSNSKFCPECGVEVAYTKENNRKFNTKKVVGILSSVILLIVILVILYQVGLSLTSPKKLVANFKDAVEKNDTEAITSLIHSNTAHWNFKKDDADLLLTFFNEYPETQEKLFNRLDYDAKYLLGETSVYDLAEKFAVISVQKNGRKWLFFDNYSLFMTPANINILVNQNEANILIGDEIVEQSSTKNEWHTYGPFSIGTYELKAILPGKYIDAEDSKQVVLYDLEDIHVEEELSINASKVEAFTTYDDTSLLLNGEQTEIKLGTTPEELGLVPIDGSVTFTLEKEFPWGIAKSKDYVVDNQRMDLRDFAALSEEEREEIMTMLNDNWAEHTKALVEGDTSKMTLVSDEYKDAVEKQAKNLHGKSKKYVATFTKARYDVETLKTPILNEEKNQYELKVEAEYTINEPELRGYSLLRDDDNSITTYYLTLYYDENEGEWKIEKYATGSFFLSGLSEIKAYDIET